MKFAHIADVHLDAAFALYAAELARERRQGIAASLRTALAVAAEERVDAVLVAGDLYEHDRVTPNTAELLRSLFAELAPTRIFIAPGNHDWLGPESLYARAEWPPNVHVFGEDRLQPVEIESGLTLWGAAHRAPANTDGFLDGFQAGRGGVNVALFHGSELGRLGFEGEGKVPHAPFRSEQIRRAGLDHLFCGHYHTPLDDPAYTYPGNPEPLTFGETSEPVRGLVLATIAADGSVARERRRVAHTEVADVAVDITGCASGEEIRERVRRALEGMTGYARVTVSGELAPEADFAPDDLRRAAPWMKAVVPRVERVFPAYDIEAISSEATVRGQFVADVMGSSLPEERKRKVVVAGLRALEGRDDLAVV